MSAGLRYERLMNGRIWRRYERSTGETVAVWAPSYFNDDFLGNNTFSTSPGAGSVWITAKTSNAGAGLVASGKNGRAQTDTGATTAQGEYALLYQGVAASGVMHWSLYDSLGSPTGLQVEMAVVLNTADASKISAMFGIGDTPAKDGTSHKITYGSYGAVVHLDGSLTPTLRTADGTNTGTGSGTALTSKTIATGKTTIFRIDLSDPSNVKFYQDGVRQGAGTVFDMSAIAAANDKFGPFFGVSLVSASSPPRSVLAVDYVRIWSGRSAA